MRFSVVICLGVVLYAGIFAGDSFEAAGTYSHSSHTESNGRPSKRDHLYKGETIRIFPDGAFVRETRRGYLEPRYSYESGRCSVISVIQKPSARRETLVSCCAEAGVKDLLAALPLGETNGLLTEQKGPCYRYFSVLRSLRRDDGKDWFSRWPDQGK